MTEAHHDSGAADKRRRLPGIEARVRNEIGDHPHAAVPFRPGAVHRGMHPDIKPAPPALQFPAEEHLPGGAGPVNQFNIAIELTMRENLVDNRPQGGQSQAAGHNNDISDPRPRLPARECHRGRGMPMISPVR